jgi:hypothetical protein
MDDEPLMDSESIGDVKKALEGFPGLAGVAVVEHGAGKPDECLVGYVVPSGPGVDVSESPAYARKTLRGGCMPAATSSTLGDRPVEAMLLAGRINDALAVRITMADLFRRQQWLTWTAASARGPAREVTQAKAKEMRR